MSIRQMAACFALSTLATVGVAQSTQGVGERRGANGGADRGSIGTTPERQVHRDDTTTRHHTPVYGPVNQGGRRYDGSSNGLQGKRGQHRKVGQNRHGGQNHTPQQNDRSPTGARQ